MVFNILPPPPSPLFKEVVRTNCCPLWLACRCREADASEPAISQMEGVQKRFTKQEFVRNGFVEVSWSERLTRRVIVIAKFNNYDQNLVYKNDNDHIDIDENVFFTSSSFSGIFKGLRIQLQKQNPKVFQESFMNWAVKTWNELSPTLIPSLPKTSNYKLETLRKIPTTKRRHEA